MKVLLVLSALVAVALSAPLDVQVPAVDAVEAQIIARRRLPALEREEVHDEFGQYAMRYVTAEGTVVSERGRLVPIKDGYVLVTEGEVSYIGDDGELYITKYTAGLDGYKVVETNHPLKAPEPVMPIAIQQTA